MQQQIMNYIRSGHSGLYIVSPEEARHPTAGYGTPIL